MRYLCDFEPMPRGANASLALEKQLLGSHSKLRLVASLPQIGDTHPGQACVRLVVATVACCHRHNKNWSPLIIFSTNSRASRTRDSWSHKTGKPGKWQCQPASGVVALCGARRIFASTNATNGSGRRCRCQTAPGSDKLGGRGPPQHSIAGSGGPRRQGL